MNLYLVALTELGAVAQDIDPAQVDAACAAAPTLHTQMLVIPAQTMAVPRCCR